MLQVQWQDGDEVSEGIMRDSPTATHGKNYYYIVIPQCPFSVYTSSSIQLWL